MKITVFFYILFGLLFLIPKTNFAITPPKITASGDQIYCAGTTLKIIETLSITHDSLEPSIKSVTVQISSGYQNDQDLLTLSNQSTLHSNITSSWSQSEGKLTLSSTTTGGLVLYSDFEAALKDVVFINSSASPSGIRNFSINLGSGELSYLPRNQHYYEYVSSLGITWKAAKVAAETRTYYGLTGYLATLTVADEAKLVGEQASGAGWIGGSDEQTEGDWKWVTGPEADTIFWNGLANGSTPNFAFWNNNEPNQSGDEDYAHITAPGVGIPGSWNDLSNTGNTSGDYQPKGYIVEFGGMPGDPILQISASTTITIPKIESTSANSNCGPARLTLQATASNGNVYWYTSKSEGTAIYTGNSYTTPFLFTTSSYFVDATNGNCPTTPRTEIIATINQIPTITATTPASRCDTGTLTLGASSSAGTINWYDVASGGTILGTGTTFTTPNISANTTYYIDATANGCTTASRTQIEATVNISPSITSTTTDSRCDSGSVSLGATASAGTINWYDVPIGGTSLGTGNTFITPSIDITTPFYVDATAATGCTSERVPIVATVYPIVKINEEVILCQNRTATLDASIPGMDYLWSPGGETTQKIIVTAIGYYSVAISSPTIDSCHLKKNISVIEHPAPIINSIIVNENSIVIELFNPENYYEFSINGLDFKDSNTFSYIPSGQHTAYVREKNGCNLVLQNFIVFTIAKYFTPNNDGQNDLWEIKEMINYPNSRVEIFDRYGRFIKQLTSGSLGWNGTNNEGELPADDYWYRLTLNNTIPVITGHFSLKR